MAVLEEKWRVTNAQVKLKTLIMALCHLGVSINQTDNQAHTIRSWHWDS